MSRTFLHNIIAFATVNNCLPPTLLLASHFDLNVWMQINTKKGKREYINPWTAAEWGGKTGHWSAITIKPKT